MSLYRFRVLIDDPSEAFRDIEILSDQSFLDLHRAIKQAFRFTGEEMASFYVSDDMWSKGQEIPLADMGFAEEGTMPPLMADTAIGDHVADDTQRFVYAYDFLNMWMFMVEMVHVGEEDPDAEYPRTVIAMGTAPAEDSRMDPILMPSDDEEGEDYTEEAEELYDSDEDELFGDEEHDEYGHGGGEDEHAW